MSLKNLIEKIKYLMFKKNLSVQNVSKVLIIELSCKNIFKKIKLRNKKISSKLCKMEILNNKTHELELKNVSCVKKFLLINKI